MTNGDRIRKMTDKELAEIIAWDIIPNYYKCSLLDTKLKFADNVDLDSRQNLVNEEKILEYIKDEINNV